MPVSNLYLSEPREINRGINVYGICDDKRSSGQLPSVPKGNPVIRRTTGYREISQRTVQPRSTA